MVFFSDILFPVESGVFGFVVVVVVVIFIVDVSFFIFGSRKDLLLGKVCDDIPFCSYGRFNSFFQSFIDFVGVVDVVGPGVTERWVVGCNGFVVVTFPFPCCIVGPPLIVTLLRTKLKSDADFGNADSRKFGSILGTDAERFLWTKSFGGL